MLYKFKKMDIILYLIELFLNFFEIFRIYLFILLVFCVENCDFVKGIFRLCIYVLLIYLVTLCGINLR